MVTRDSGAPVGLVAFVALFWTLAASSFAASLKISFETSQVVEGVPFAVHATGTTQGLRERSYYSANYTVRPAGGAPCAPTYGDDSGSGDGHTVPDDAPFDLTIDQSQQIDTPGNYIVCGWIMGYPGSTKEFGPVSDQFTVRPAKASLSISLSPAQVTRREPTTLTANYEAEIPLRLRTKIKPAGPGCAPTYAADTGTGQTTDDVSGAGSISRVLHGTDDDPGSYDVCAWLEKPSEQRGALAGPVRATLTIVAPPPPDRDADGVPDATNRCVSEKGLVERSGCPVPAACVSARALVVKRTASRKAASAKLKKIRKAAAKRPLRRSRRRALRKQQRAASKVLKRRKALLKTARSTRNAACALPS